MKAELGVLKLVTEVHLVAFSAVETTQLVIWIPPVHFRAHKDLLHPSQDPTPAPKGLR